MENTENTLQNIPLTDAIDNMFDNRKRVEDIADGLMLVCALADRPGLSQLISTSYITKVLNELGIPTGPGPDGSPNLIVKAVSAIVGEVFRAITFDAKTLGAAEIGSLGVESMGANAGGPVLSKGVNTLTGVIRSITY